MSLAGKIGIVTGGGSGLGEASAKKLAAEGAGLIVADRNAEDAERVAAGIRSAGGDATAFHADVSVLADVEKMVSFADATYGGLDIAFNNAGITPRLVDVAEIDPTDWLRVIEVNLTGTFYCVQAEIGYMLGHGGGAIVNMASTAGLMAHAGRAAYAASKHGIIGLTRSVAVEYAKRGIRVNAVAPGPILTPPMANAPASVRESSAAKTAMGRVGTMSEVASVVAFLLSDETGYTTGSVYELNGGQTQL
jgi:NAD(P)-dependent dehydrogenase (short-subunit alcohol dehydrogenase family)